MRRGHFLSWRHSNDTLWLTILCYAYWLFWKFLELSHPTYRYLSAFLSGPKSLMRWKPLWLRSWQWFCVFYFPPVCLPWRCRPNQIKEGKSNRMWVRPSPLLSSSHLYVKRYQTKFWASLKPHPINIPCILLCWDSQVWSMRILPLWWNLIAMFGL